VAIEPGTMVATETPDGPRVDRADERIWLADDFFAELTERPTDFAGIIDGVFTVRAVNGTWTYEIVGPVAGERCVEAKRVSGP
jgi:hypothetical protein